MIAPGSPDYGVDQRAIQLLDGHAGLHEIGISGEGVVVGLIDSGLSHGPLTPWLRTRSSVVPGVDPDDTDGHGTRIATSIIQGAPGVLISSIRVFDARGRVFRHLVARGIAAAREDAAVTQLNLSLELERTPQLCRDDAPCVACRAVTEATGSGLLVIVAGGNTGLRGGALTCPGAAEGAFTILATSGPAESRRPALVRAYDSGTSISAALVSAGCVLLRSVFPDSTSTELQAALQATSTSLLSAPGIKTPHFYRAYRYLAHLRAGHRVDVTRAETLARSAVQRMGRPSGGDQGTEATVAMLKEAISLAPWGARLHLALASVVRDIDALTATAAITEALRLEWAIDEAHSLLSYLLARSGDARGSAVEVAIASKLKAGDQLGAADELLAGLAGGMAPANV